MENSLLILTVAQSILILALCLAIIFFGYKFYQDKANSQTNADNPKRLENRVKKTTGNCQFHPQLKAEASCAICGALVCESCAKAQGKIHFCPEHNETYKTNTWEALETVKASPDDTTASEYLFKFKQSLWDEKKVPTYIQVHYQINVDDDTIISEVTLFCIKEYVDQYRLLIQNNKEGMITQ